MTYQSELTHILVMEILNNGVCDLTPIYESFQIHKSLLEEFNKHLKRVPGKNYLKTPLT